jgi:hypothetical protein
VIISVFLGQGGVPGLAATDISSNVHYTITVMRNNQFPISTHAFIILIVELKCKLNKVGSGISA